MAALELPYVNLVDALVICLLMRRQGDPRFERAAVRWLGRLSLERSDGTLADLRRASSALSELPSEHAKATLAFTWEAILTP